MPDPRVTALHYGKAAVRFYRTDSRDLFAGEVALDAFGDTLRPAWTAGDNTPIVATDSMKNFIHAAALEYPGDSLEEFTAFVGRRFVETYPHVERVHLRARELPFAREGAALYRRTYDDYGAVELTMDAAGILAHRCGREALRLLKVSGSSFAGFVRDEYTTLPETRDRPLFMYVSVHWRHRTFEDRVPTPDVRGVVTETFEGFESRSIQDLVHEMGQRILRRFPAIIEVSFDAENRTRDAAALRPPAGSLRAVYTDPRPPFGVICLTLTR